MSAASLMSELRRLGVSFTAEGDQLRLRAAKGILTSDLKDAIKEHKAAILTLLRAQVPEASTVPALPNRERFSCVHELFQAQVKRTPDAVAVVCDEEALTYKELNDRANQLAHYLRSLGVGPEVLVGVCLDRSLEMVVALLGTLKSGGAYVPMDPQHPKERLRYVLEDTQAPVLVTEERLSGLAKRAHVVCFGAQGHEIAEHSHVDPAAGTAGNNTAYVTYTSGSTGRPKGVQNHHAGLWNLVRWHQRFYDVTDDDRATQVASLSFDASVWEVWPYLTAGASLHIVDDQTRLSPPALVRWLVDRRITLCFLPTPLAEQVLDADWPEETSLRCLLTGGDQLRRRKKLPFRLINHYGPTEASVVATCGDVEPDGENPALPHIGRPITNAEVYLLDGALQPVPIGVAGNLHIGGCGVATGYLRRPRLTAEKFLPHPFSERAGERLYQTGDLCRWLPNGNIEFSGRMDQQIKVSGFRIELGEIESVLAQHPAVRNAVVLARENATAGKQIVAYVVPNLERIIDDSSEQSGQEAEQISRWRELYDDTYQQAAPEDDPAFNIVGWNSSYTGEPIPAEEMRTWVESAVERILALRPRRVLEIGCGTGLLLFRIAPHCTKYWATDFSPRAIEYIDNARQTRQELTHVELFRRQADDFSNTPEQEFNLVILNSVVQYFPDIQYLLRVIEGAVSCVAPNGAVFLGDLRHFPLLPTFHASVQLEHASPTLSRSDFARRVRQQVAQESELAVDPAFFRVLKQHLARVGQVETLLKRGRDKNELTRFRYDAVLHIDAPVLSVPAPEEVDWEQAGMTFSTLRDGLAHPRSEHSRIMRVPNGRVSEAVRTWEWLQSSEGPETIGEWRRLLESDGEGCGVDPEDFWTLGAELGYDVHVSYSVRDAGRRYEVALRRRSDTGENHSPFGLPDDADASPPKVWSEYANNPLRTQQVRVLASRLRNALEKKLPGYMVPSTFVMLDSLPLSPAGKIDRRALSTVEPARSGLHSPYVAPRDPEELQLVQLWEDVLGTRPIGVRDDFFDLGGHSMMAVKLIGQIEQTFGKRLPLAELFQQPTVERLAELLRSDSQDKPWSAVVPIQTGGSRPPLFCIHPAGGAAFCYAPLARRLGPDQPVYGVQARGIEGEQPPDDDLHVMAAHYIEEICRVQPHGPYYLAGWSLGGAIAFEMAQQLHSLGQDVGVLALIDGLPPLEEIDLGSLIGSERVDDALVIAFAYGGKLDLSPEVLRQLDPDEQVKEFLRRGVEANIIPSSVRPSQVRHMLEVYKANFMGYCSYRARPYDGPVVLFRPEEQNEVDHRLRELITGDLDIRVVPGDHYTLALEPNVEVLARYLTECIDNANASAALSAKRT